MSHQLPLHWSSSENLIPTMSFLKYKQIQQMSTIFKYLISQLSCGLNNKTDFRRQHKQSSWLSANQSQLPMLHGIKSLQRAALRWKRRAAIPSIQFRGDESPSGRLFNYSLRPSTPDNHVHHQNVVLQHWSLSLKRMCRQRHLCELPPPVDYRNVHFTTCEVHN